MYSHTMTKRVMIVGGGIAGTLTATALHEAGIEAEVHEAYERASDGVGLFVTLAVNGLNSLESLGLRETVEGLGMANSRMHMFSGRTGRELGSSEMRARTTERSDLYGALRAEAERRGVPIVYGSRLVDVEHTAAGVRATFANGDVREADLLVGADGLRSRVRELLDPKAPRPRHIGLLNTGGYAHAVRMPGVEDGAAAFVFGKRCFFGGFQAPGGGVWWFANPARRAEPTRAELAAITPEAWRAELNELFADDEGPMLEVVAATPEIFPPWNTYDFPRVPIWHDDRIVIIGDAAHATSPSAGQGASMAIEDAVALARCLRQNAAPAEAFRAYEGERRARVEKVVAFGRRNGTGKAAGPIGARIRDAMMPYVMRKFATPESQSWLLDHRVPI
jgi:2-polyprenyl-6-methoxyphenol hydroxylase-like FAD-dependent oxidoreductase